MHAGGIWCKTKIQIDHGGLEVNFSLQEGVKRTVGDLFIAWNYDKIKCTFALFACPVSGLSAGKLKSPGGARIRTAYSLPRIF